MHWKLLCFQGCKAFGNWAFYSKIHHSKLSKKRKNFTKIWKFKPLIGVGSQKDRIISSQRVKKEKYYKEREKNNKLKT